jgi:hypothetical protein
VDLADEHQLL